MAVDMSKDQKNYALSTMKPKQEDDSQERKATCLDEIELFLQEHDISLSWLQEFLTDETRFKELRRIDSILLSLLRGTYFLQYIDKQVCFGPVSCL